MKPIVTLTLNPTIDGASEAEVVRPTRKVRTTAERFDPGGGGINVARVLVELGRAALPVYLAGGATGGVLDALMEARGLAARPVPIRDHTRISHAVFERATGREYRFVPEGPEVSAAEWRACLGVLEEIEFDWLVASGSSPRGLGDDAYAEVARLVAQKGGRFVLDTSGPALAATLQAGGVHLVKPSLGEFEAMVGARLGGAELKEAAMALVRDGRAELVAVTMGHRGALLASRDGVLRTMPPAVEARSATGAGDSFVGGMTWGLAEGRAPREAFLVGLAAGTAAVLTPGTDLCRRDDVWRLYAAIAGAG